MLESGALPFKIGEGESEGQASLISEGRITLSSTSSPPIALLVWSTASILHAPTFFPVHYFTNTLFAEPLWTDPGIKNGISVGEQNSTLEKKKKKKAQAGN